MKARLQQNGSLVLTDRIGEVRIILPVHPHYATLMRLYQMHATVALSAAHAPAGYTHAHPLVIQGDSYTGGEFIPGDVVADATPLEKAEIKGQVRQDASMPAEGYQTDDEHKAPPGFGGHPWIGGTPEPNEVYNIPLEHIHRDPERFQYKQDVNKKGVTDQFAGVKFDPRFAGVLAVWKDPADGQTYVINGHHRLELAERSGGVPTYASRYIEAKDAKEARGIGALLNIADGKGTAMDAAKFMRDSGMGVEDIKKQNVSMKGKIAADGAVLARLNDRLFDKVARGQFPEETALAIGRHLPDHHMQDQLAGFLSKKEESGKEYAPKVIEDMAKEMAATPTHTTSEHTLFGDIESEDSLFGERNELKNAVRAELSKAVNDFRAVSSERRAGVVGSAGNVLDVAGNKKAADSNAQTLAIFDKLVNSRGLISDALNEGAKEYAEAKGKKAKDAARAKTVEACRAAVEQESLHPGTMGKNVPGGEAAPAGPGGELPAPADRGERDQAVGDGLTYEQFAKEYLAHFKQMSKYTPDQVGASDFAGKMAELADKHPEWVERIEAEEEAKAKPARAASGIKNATHAAEKLDGIRNRRHDAGASPEALKREVDEIGAWAAAQKNQTPIIRKVLQDAHQLADQLEGGSGKGGNRIEITAEAEPQPPLPEGWEIKTAGEALGLFRDGRETPVATAETHDELTDKIHGAKRAKAAPIDVENAPKSKGHVAFVGKHEYYRGADGALYKASITKKLGKTGTRNGDRSNDAEMEKSRAKLEATVKEKRPTPPPQEDRQADQGVPAKRGDDALPGDRSAPVEREADQAGDQPDAKEVSHADLVKEAKTFVGKPNIGLLGHLKAYELENYTAEKLQEMLQKAREATGTPPASAGQSERLPDTAQPAGDDAVKKPSPHLSLAEHLAERLGNNETITAAELFAAADKHHGGTRAEGKYGPSEAYDSLETGFNIALAGKTDPGADLDFALAQVEDLQADVDNLPTQTNRSGNKDSFQQFSTPPHYAFAVAWLANLNPEDTVLEPSAGTGSIAVHAANTGAHVIANEKDPQRAALLAHQLGTANVHQENAEQIGAILPGRGVKPSAVVMNPPFSQTAGRLGDKKVLMTGANHISEALQTLEPGGRLVAIVGGGISRDGKKKAGMSMDSPTYRQWFADLAKNGYTLRANVGVGGDEYKKYGTHFGTRTLIIDKVAPGENTLPAVIGEAEDIPDLMRKLEGVRNDRPKPEGTPGVDAGGGLPGQAEHLAQPEGDAAPATGDLLPGQPGAGGLPRSESLPSGTEGRSAPAGDSGPGVSGEPVPAGPGSVPGATPGDGDSAWARVADPVGTPGPVASGPQEGAVNRRGGKAARGKSPQQPHAPVPELRPAAPVELEDTRTSAAAAGDAAKKPVKSQGELSTSIYERYKPQDIHVKGAKPHPSPLDESAAMAAVPPPPVTYRPHLSPDLVEGKVVKEVQPDGTTKERYIGVSEAQLEAAVYAGQAHEQMLPAAEGEKAYRRGHLLGDGTGTGKGREIATIMTDNTNQGRKKHVWISQKQSLLGDAGRDWADLGNDPNKLFHFDKIRHSEAPPEDGVAFITYDTLKGRPKDPTAPSNLDELVKWLGEDFDGVIAFDEAHSMGNAMPMKGARGKTTASKRALAGLELQKRLPNARVEYVTATPATELANLGYMDRLGIWGRGTPFATKEDFVSEMARGGVASMEAVPQSLKAMGLYTARKLSLNDGTPQGTVTYERLPTTLEPAHKAQYDALAEAWQHVLLNVDNAMEASGASDSAEAKGAAASQFWGAHQRFFNQIITSMQVPAVINAMEKDIAEGRAPVVQLFNTMEASTNRALQNREDDEELEELDVGPRDILTQFLQNSFPVHRYEKSLDDNGNTISVLVRDSHGDPVEDPAAVAMRDELIANVKDLHIHDSPLDMIINHFGPEAVSEVTGRKQRLIWTKDEHGRKVKAVESRGNVNQAETQAFQGGKKKILVFSAAGGTGSSYHADKRAGNQKQRVHYPLQLGWRADNMTQGLGRTHRTNQVNAPIVRLPVLPDVPGNKRFTSSVARRLDQMGGLGAGQRQTGSQGVFSAADNLESTQAQEALGVFFRDLKNGRIEGLSHAETMKQLGYKLEDEKSKSGRQKKVETPPITQFLNRILSLKLDLQNKVFDAFEERLQAKVEQAEQDGTLDVGVENFPADKIIAKSNKSIYKEPVTGAESHHFVATTQKKVKKRSWEANAQPGKEPLAYLQNKQSGRVWAVYKGFDKMDPKTGNITSQMILHGPTSKTTRAAYELYNVLQGRTDYGGGNFTKLDEDEAQRLWESEYNSAPEFTTSEEHFVTGAFLPIWDRIPGEHPKIYRLRTEDGQTLVGRHVPAEDVDEFRKRMNITDDSSAGGNDAASVHGQIASGRSIARLVNGWKLKPARVQNERRIEITGPNRFQVEEMEKDGVFKEKIGSEWRYFVPAGEEGAKVLDRITKSRPIMDVEPIQLSAAIIDPEASADVRTEALKALRKLFPLSLYDA